MDYAGLWDARVDAQVDVVLGPVICGRQNVQWVLNAFSDTRKVLTTEQVGEEVGKDNLLLHTPRMSLKRE